MKPHLDDPHDAPFAARVQHRLDRATEPPGGLEIATLAGAVLQAARQRRVILVDGSITTTAVAVAAALAPTALAWPLLLRSAELLAERASFDAAGVSERGP